MASEPARAADELTSAIRSIVARAFESQTRNQIAARGREMAAAIAETAGTAAGRTSEMAGDAWRDSAPQRREAAKTAKRASRDALKWGRRTWMKQLRPALGNAWSRRAAAIGAAGLAVPASRELVDQARVRLGIRQREEHRWRMFFLGIVLGAIGGAVAALLTAPRPGREMRDELAARARDAATNASEWVPIFQRDPEEQIADEKPVSLTEPAPQVSESEPSPVKAPRPQKRAGGPTEGVQRSSKGNGAEGYSPPSIPDTDQPESETV